MEASVLGTLNGGQSTQLVKPNYLVLSFLTSHRRRTIVSLETYPLCSFPLTSKTLIYVYLITLRNIGYEKTLIWASWSGLVKRKQVKIDRGETCNVIMAPFLACGNVGTESSTLDSKEKNHYVDFLMTPVNKNKIKNSLSQYLNMSST